MKQSIQAGFFVFFNLIVCVNAAAMVPFVIGAEVNPASEIAMDFQPLTAQDRLAANEHFINHAGKHVRLWGVNLSFGANFPTQQDAERIAKRMAAFGVNSVRFHHMDTDKWPRGLWDKTGRELHPEALDRLDYFIDQLAKHGIYTDLNLHVGRKHSAVLGLPESPTDYDKMVNIFTPELVAAQKDFARALLTHINPYRNMTYAEDYAVGIVEITNENSLFMWGAENTLRTLPAYYADILQRQYNDWLRRKYKTQDRLETAWLGDSVPLGENLLKDLDVSAGGETAWRLEQHDNCRADVSAKPYKDKPALCMDPTRIDGTGWHLQYNQSQLDLQKVQVYTVEFEAAAPVSRQITVGVGQAHEPWANLGLSQSVTLTPEWKTYRMNFIATDDDTNGRLSFYFGDDDNPFYLATVKLCSGVEYTLNEGESLDDRTIELFGQTESMRRRIDRMVFLAETEKAYFDGMRSFIKDDLNCSAMVTGTIVFGPLGLYAQSDMDFIDSHAYWQHPRFPNRPWDPGDWTVEQKAMSEHPDEGTLYRLAAERLAGKPFTVTEYNHPAPLDAQAECVPMIASFAAAQDWDGVWLYTYSHSHDNWEREHLNSYFDIDTNPAKWGFMPAGAVMFRNAALQPFRRQIVYALASPDENRMNALTSLHLRIDRNLFTLVKDIVDQDMNTALCADLQSPFQDRRISGRLSLNVDLLWNVVNNRGVYVSRNDNVCVVTGQTSRFSEIARPLKLQIDRPGFAAVAVAALDDKPLAASEKILITACGRCENTGMGFSADRQTVGRNWGEAPVLIEPVEGKVTLLNPTDNAEYICKILNPDGSVKQQIGLTDGTVPLKAEYGTMWYLIERAK